MWEDSFFFFLEGSQKPDVKLSIG